MCGVCDVQSIYIKKKCRLVSWLVSDHVLLRDCECVCCYDRCYDNALKEFVRLMG